MRLAISLLIYRQGNLKPVQVFGLAALLFAATSQSVTAQSAPPLPGTCPAPYEIPERPVVDEALDPDETYLTADEADSIEGGISRLQGQAEVTRNSQQARANVIDYDRAREVIDLRGDVNYWDEEIYLHGEAAHIDLEEESARIDSTRYYLLSNRGHGKADELYVLADRASEGRGIDYTTCNPQGTGDQPSYTWMLSADQITLDHESDWGIGRNVVLRIKDIPVFYTPYISFPLNNERKTGFLTPEYGNTRRNGLEIQTPFYWNIAPNMDATITPRLISDSGLMVMGEYRYLFENGYGQMSAEYLPSDSNYNDEDRSYLSLEHQQSLPHNGRLHVLLNNFSDNRYHEDFGPTLDFTSQSAADRFMDLSFSGNNWRAFARLQDFQLINRSTPFTLDPYKRLPQLGFNYTSPVRNRELNYEIDSEFVYFTRNEVDLTGAQRSNFLTFPSISVLSSNIPDTVTNQINNFNLPVVSNAAGFTFFPTNIVPNYIFPDIDGSRFHVNPSISYPFRTVSSFIIPRVGIQYTRYSLNDDAELFDENPDRFLPYASLDAGLFMDRELNFSDESYIQTLEPRLFYAYTPRENQDDLPVFDTGLYDNSFDSLFYLNRYSGIDRINDANRITLAVTSRIINNRGIELGHLSIGQMFYLDDQEVSLPGQFMPDDDLSPLVFELGANLSEDLSVTAGWQWEPNENNMQKVDLQARYRPGTGKVFNIAYRVREAARGVIRTDAIDIEQTDVSFRWPLTSEVNVVGRWVYALEESKSLDIFGGLEYESCCWGMRLVGRRFVSNIEGDVQTGIFLQFELKGLAGIGQKTVDFLNQNIPGYQSGF